LTHAASVILKFTRPLAPSFQGKYGGVSYFITAYIDQDQLPPLEARKSFEVVENIDVNTPSLLSPVGGSKEKRVTFFFLSDGYVCIAAKIDRKGYCPGEIAINAQFQNNCSRIVVPKAAILAKQTYLVNGRTKIFREKLTSVRGNHIITGMSVSWQGKSLRIPKVTPSINSNMIRLEYSLLIYVHIPGTNKLVLELPVVIGTIPYSGFNSRSSSVTSIASNSSASMSWPRFEFPEQMEAPPCYVDRADNSLIDSPTSPLLNEYDRVLDSPIFMCVPPPTYTEVSE
uniref:Thioredoxin-interacting protein n=1 Tax=Callorhinchus milii TaxID=7868 RepID=A0A4W3GHF4_CALMI